MIEPAQLGPGVTYEPTSTHRWEDLNETVFLARVFAELRALMGASFRDYQWHVLSTRDGRAVPASLSDPSPRKVLIVISDESGREPDELRPHFLAIFKSYLRRDLPGTNVFPFCLGYVREVTAEEVKPVDIRPVSAFFSGNLSASRLGLYRALHPLLRRLPPLATRGAYDVTRRRRGRLLAPSDLSAAIPGAVLRFNDGFKRGLPAHEYARTLADSRIALCPAGASSPETFRHVEAARAGTVVVSEPLPSTWLYRDAPVVTVGDWVAGVAQVRALLADPQALRERQRATIAWWDDVLSERATARYVAERLAGMTA